MEDIDPRSTSPQRRRDGRSLRPGLGRALGAARQDPVTRPLARDRAGDLPREPRTILVAEDDEGMRRLYTDVLREGGYRVLSARDGSEAAALAGADDLQIDAIVTDLVMPGMRGEEVAGQIRLRWTRIPVLLLSGYAIDARRLAARFGPRCAFLHKPFSPKMLLKSLVTLLAASETDRDVRAN